jgi:hypothetical protein
MNAKQPVEVISLDCQAGQHADCRHRWPVFLLIQEENRGEVQSLSAVCICWCHAEKEAS